MLEPVQLISVALAKAIGLKSRSKRSAVQRAAERAGGHGTIIDVPNPGRWTRQSEIFLLELVPQLKHLLDAELKG